MTNAKKLKVVYHTAYRNALNALKVFEVLDDKRLEAEKAYHAAKEG